MVVFKPSIACSMLHARLVWILIQRHAGIFQCQPHGIDRLDDAVVQVHADALALFQHGQATRLAVQAGVFDGDASPAADGGQQMELALLEAPLVTACHAHHAHHRCRRGQGNAGHATESRSDHRRAQVAHIVGKISGGQRLADLRHQPDESLADAEMIPGQEGFGELAAVQRHCSSFSLSSRRKISPAPTPRYAITRVRVRSRISSTSSELASVTARSLTSARSVVALAQGLVPGKQVFVKAGVLDRHRGVCRQGFDHALVGFGELAAPSLLVR